MGFKEMKANSKFDTAKLNTGYWKNSKSKKWELQAKESYERISKKYAVK